MAKSLLNLLLATTIGLVASALHAQPMPPPDGPGEGRAEPDPDRRPMPRWSRIAPGEISEQEWSEVEAFLRDHSPYRLELLERVPETSRTYHRLRAAMVLRYRHMERVRQQDGRAYELLIAQFGLEDEALRLANEFRSAPPERQAQLRSELRQIATELVQSSIQERRRRIEELEVAIREERARLQEDQRDVSALVDRRLDQLLNWGLEVEGEGRPGGPGRLEGERRPDGPRRPEGERRPPGERPPRRP